ncbi:MAG: tail fiber domain-containing protein, partial [Saprospiraceae bacterium]|nr:tail fiber domain-containing protein [Saprospiraceae bacterium]
TLSGSGGILDCGDINSPQPEEAIAIGGVCQNNESQAYIRAIRSTSTVNGLDIRVVNEDTPDTDGANQRGILLNVQNGSNDNDGVIILSRANNGANGMKIAAQSNGDDATGLRIFAGETDIDNINEDGNGTAQNYGVYIDLQDRVNNNGSGAPDIGLYVNDNNPDFNWAIFADGDTRARDIYAADDAFIDDQLYTDDAIVNRNFYIRNTNGNVWRYSVLANGNLGFYYGNNGGQNQLGSFINTTGVYQISDQSLKENIRPLSATLSKMMLLQPYQYNYTHDPLKKNTVGFLAQDVEKLFPEVVMNAENEDGSEVLTVNYAGFAVLAVKSVQEMQQTIEKQQTVISQQEARLLSLEKEMAELKALFKASNEDKK